MIAEIDRRAWILFAPVFALAIATSLIEDAHPAAAFLYPALYVSWIVLGGGFAYFDLKEGYCMNRTTVTREDSPFQFWSEVAVSFAAIFFGIQALAKLWLL